MAKVDLDWYRWNWFEMTGLANLEADGLGRRCVDVTATNPTRPDGRIGVSAAFACRASRDTTGRSSLFRARQCQADVGPVSRVIRTDCGALYSFIAKIASGVDAHLSCHTTPAASTTHTAVFALSE